MKYINDNLLDAFDRGDVKYIAHQCNCFASLYKGKAKGIAGSIMKRYPEAAEVDGELKEGLSRLGKVAGWHSSGKQGYGYNLYAQYKYGNSAKTGIVYTDYEALNKCLSDMCDAISLLMVESTVIGIPRIGCGLAGGDWNVVSSILKSVEQQCGVEFWVYDLEKVEGTVYSG